MRDHVDVSLTIVGAGPDDVEPILHDQHGVTALGKVDDATKERVLREADVLAAPSLGGESFGMVLTEAFAAGTPVVASDIPGYRDVVRDGVDGVLVERGDATALAEALRDLALDPARRDAHGCRRGRARAALRLAAASPPRSLADLRGRDRGPRAGDRARATRRCAPAAARRHAPEGPGPAPRVAGDRQAQPRSRGARRAAARRRHRRRGRRRRPGFLALQRIGLDKIGSSLLESSPSWVLLALALMCLSMVDARDVLARDPQGGAAQRQDPALATPSRAPRSAC